MDHLDNHFRGILLIVLGVGSVEISRGKYVFYGLAMIGFGSYLAFL